ncbi:hypothetical protein RRF57_004015 [Xylaria bambusicola]|uniref:Uncharacterized protein n=1 Tax=Xylaria bambusicola TaxID=326684 RepID=A0AAN7U9Y1_9PEZI
MNNKRQNEGQRQRIQDSNVAIMTKQLHMVLHSRAGVKEYEDADDVVRFRQAEAYGWRGDQRVK